LTATIAPANATNQNVSWSSNKSSVASVSSNGLVTAVSAGSAVITVTTADGIRTATCTVTVSAATGNVTFNANGGNGTVPVTQTASIGSNITLPNGSGLSRSGYSFGGWNTNTSGTGTSYKAGDSYTVTGNVILYAKWDDFTSVTGFEAKLTWLQTNAASGGDYTIEANANESIDPKSFSYSDKTNITIRLKGIGSMRSISLSTYGSMFTVNSGVTLILDENITLVGRSPNNASLVFVSGGTLIMNDKTKIYGNTGSPNSGGGGVRVISNGIFIMNGGEISGNTIYSTSTNYSPVSSGGGVYVSGNFTMNGGEISGNTASSPSTGSKSSPGSSGGGVWVGGTFTMNGGKISGNVASSFSPHNPSAYGGGVVAGNFTMNGGEISGNVTDASSGKVTNASYNSKGGGVYCSSVFIKTGSGIITGYSSDNANGNMSKNNNVVNYYSGHAVYVNSSSSTMHRETTAGSGVNLDSRVSGAAGGWEN
jgi:hypothetical protein